MSGRGAVEAHPLWERGVAGSNPAAPTIKQTDNQRPYSFEISFFIACFSELFCENRKVADHLSETILCERNVR